MRIKLDENLPDRLQAAVAELGHDVDTVVLEGLEVGTTPPFGVRRSKRDGS